MTHKHEIKNCAHSFRINPSDRGIYKTSPGNIILIQGDHNSVRFSFSAPRYINGHDMSLCNKIELNYINISSDKANKTEDVYIVQDMAVDATDEKRILFSWLLSKNATKYAGTLSFLIEFLCVKEDATASYSWHTDKHTLTMTEGMDNEETVVEAISDILAVWEEKVIHTAKEVATKEITTIVKDLSWYGKIIEEFEKIEINSSDFTFSEEYGLYLYTLPMEDALPTDLQMVVTYNGTKYAEKTKEYQEGIAYVGNAALIGIGNGTGIGEDSGEPFAVGHMGIYFIVIAKDAATITVQKIASDIEQIPEEYLPLKKLATKEYVKGAFDSAIGDIDTALDAIIEIQNSLIGDYE